MLRLPLPLPAFFIIPLPLPLPLWLPLPLPLPLPESIRTPDSFYFFMYLGFRFRFHLLEPSSVSLISVFSLYVCLLSRFPWFKQIYRRVCPSVYMFVTFFFQWVNLWRRHRVLNPQRCVLTITQIRTFGNIPLLTWYFRIPRLLNASKKLALNSLP